MHVIKVRNVHEALPEAIRWMNLVALTTESRNGTVLMAPMPVATVYEQPRERVLFWPQRDANPFFHFYEALWMLGGRNDVASLERFVKRMRTFSDDGNVFHGAYGYRWRRYFGMDQLLQIAGNLLENPTCRRQVLQLWDPAADLVAQAGKKDLPCNLTATFQVHPFGALDLCVFNRSNDILWGCYGANAVHFSMLLEFMAALIKRPVGTYTQISVNWHAYTERWAKVLPLEDFARDTWALGTTNPYALGEVEPFPMVNGPSDVWLSDLAMFLDEGTRALGYRDVFFRRVAVPMLRTHERWVQSEKKGRFEAAWQAAQQIRASDWRTAVEQWLMRRKDNS